MYSYQHKVGGVFIAGLIRNSASNRTHKHSEGKQTQEEIAKHCQGQFILWQFLREINLQFLLPLSIAFTSAVSAVASAFTPALPQLLIVFCHQSLSDNWKQQLPRTGTVVFVFLYSTLTKQFDVWTNRIIMPSTPEHRIFFSLRGQRNAGNPCLATKNEVTVLSLRQVDVNIWGKLKNFDKNFACDFSIHQEKHELFIAWTHSR